MNALEPPFFPIIYVRGYAMSQTDIDETTADPFMGFNLGSTYARHDAHAALAKFYFESPVIRLAKDHDYVDAFQHGGMQWAPRTAPSRSIWIYRFYEQASTTLGLGSRAAMEEIAAELRAFILRIRTAICGDDATERRRFKVILVAHSMGGLVCRCYLQNICRFGTGDGERDELLELDKCNVSEPIRDITLVDKVFTFASPHNGIDVRGLGALRLPVDRWQLSNFNKDRIAEYLRLSKRTRSGGVNHLDGAFDPRRVFCLMGSNYRDYPVASGAFGRLIGPGSDGLVMMSNAYTEGSSRVVVHRSHSGPHGIVNSEAGYQNLRRFLFGTHKVIAKLYVDAVESRTWSVVLPTNTNIVRSFYVEASVWVRGPATYRLNERMICNESSMLKLDEQLLPLDRGNKPSERRFAYLFTGYVMPDDFSENDESSFAIEVGLRLAGLEIDGRDRFSDIVDGDLLRETLTFRLKQNQLSYGLASEHGLGNSPVSARLTELSSLDENGVAYRGYKVPLLQAHSPPTKARLELNVSAWNVE